jgi:hypothetical protein
MICEILGIIGLCYLVIGMLNLKPKWGDEIYTKFWGFNPPSTRVIISIGIWLIICGVLLDIMLASILSK